MTPPTRAMAIGLDAANPHLLDRWIEDGTLPNLRRLVERGMIGRLTSVDGFFGATWPSLYTATNPARNGVHYELQIRSGTYDLHWVAESEFVRELPFWDVLSGAGCRVAALDVPLSRLSPDIDGVQVVEWGGHDSLLGFQTAPPELADELTSRFGSHPAGPSCDGERSTAADYRQLVDQLELGIRCKTEWSGELLARGGWDLFVQVFTEGHCVGHQCWHLHDPSHPAHNPRIAADIGDPLKRVYAAIDEAVGELVAAAGDVPVMVFSGHGMSHFYGAQFLLPEILERLGVTVPLPAVESHTEGLWKLARMAWRHTPPALKDRIRTVRDALRPAPGARAVPQIRFDTTLSPCFPLNNGQAAGGIRLNLKGREPTGVLRPGAEADEFCDRLIADLSEIIDERTGEPLIREVKRTGSLHSGENIDLLPDLLVEWSDSSPTGSTGVADGAAATVRARSPKMGVVEGSNDYCRTGEHRAGGWFVAAGPTVPHGALDRVPSLMDLPPTWAAMLGVEMPDVDGDPIHELLG